MAAGRRPNPAGRAPSWNRLRYTLWAPGYDLIGRRFDGRRRESLRLLAPKPGERVLIVGAGTGADLPYLPAGVRVLATDLTWAMLTRARARLRPEGRLAIMDGQRLAVAPGAFDGVVLHLILAVIDDPARCLQEAARALRPGGRLVVFDKFVRSERVPLALRGLNLLARPFFTDVTRRFEDILKSSGAPLRIEHDAPALLGGFFRHLLLTAPPSRRRDRPAGRLRWYRGAVRIDGSSTMERLSHRERLQLLRFVCSFVWADLNVSDAERGFVHRMVKKLKLTPAEAREVEGWLEVPPSPESVDPGSIPLAHRSQFIEAVRGAAAADGALAPEEREDLALFEQLLR